MGRSSSSCSQTPPEMFDADGQPAEADRLHRAPRHAQLPRRASCARCSAEPEAVVAIHGGVRREERRKVQEASRRTRTCLVLVATDAAGEGINLQRAHLMVNYDLPWNPNRIEQRFGRIHRIGQTEVCHLWNLVADETREGQVFQRLFEKLEEQRKALGDQVFDVLGEAFRGRRAARPADRGDPLRRAARRQGPARRGRRRHGRRRACARSSTSAPSLSDVMTRGRRRAHPRRDGARRGAQAAAALHPRVLPGGVRAARRPRPSSASRAGSRSPTCPPSCAAATARSAWARRCCAATSASPSTRSSIASKASPLAEYLSPRAPAARRHHRPDHRALRHAPASKARSSSTTRTRREPTGARLPAARRRRRPHRRVGQSARSSRSASSSSRSTRTATPAQAGWAPYLDCRPHRAGRAGARSAT